MQRENPAGTAASDVQAQLAEHQQIDDYLATIESKARRMRAINLQRVARLAASLGTRAA